MRMSQGAGLCLRTSYPTSFSVRLRFTDQRLVMVDVRCNTGTTTLDKILLR